MSHEPSAASPLPQPMPQGTAHDLTGPPQEKGGYPDYAREPRGTRDWRRYLAAVLRYKWLVLLGTALGVAGGLGAARLVKPQYLAEATVWIETPDRQGAGPIRSGQLLESYGWVELLKSYAVLDQAVQELRLYLEVQSPADSGVFGSFRLGESFAPGEYRLSVNDAGTLLTLTTASGVVLQGAAVGDSVGGALGFAWVPEADALVPGQSVRFSVVTPRDAARALAARLRTTVARDGNFLRVRLSGTAPPAIAAAVNAIVVHLVGVAAQLKREKLSELAKILSEQLQHAERNLREAEIELESFRIATITLPSERASPLAPGIQLTQNPVLGNFFDMQLEGEQLARDREAIEHVLAQVADSGLPAGALEVIPAVQRSSEVRGALGELTDKHATLRVLRYRYRDDHPSLQRLLAEIQELEHSTIPMLGRALVAELTGRHAEMNSRIGSASKELQQIPPRAIEEARLRRNVAVAENLYTRLQARHEEARLAEASSIPDVRILDLAVVPREPVSNQRPRLLLMGAVGGLGLSLLLAIMLDRLDRRVRYLDQITSELGLPLLGAVPHLKGMRNGATASAQGSVIEALRGVRLNLVHAHGTAGPLLVTVTSPGSGDGKSFIACNLALAFAEAGHDTLLVDGDGRRGSLHRVLNAARKPGLTDFLSGNASRSEVVQETEYRSVYFIASGTRTPHAPELLGSQAMSGFVASLRAAPGTNVVIVDSPPLGAGVDAFALATMTGNLLMVLRLGATDRELAEAKLDVLDRLPVRVLGAVLNDVRGGAEYRHYRHYAYCLPGYEHEDEVGDPAGREAGVGKRGLTPKAATSS